MLRYAGRLIVAVLLCGTLAVAMGAAASGPRLEVQPQKLEFGTMKRGEKERKVLYVRNAGDSQLTIEQIRPSCTECIVDQIPLRPLAPGQGMELPITFLASDVPGEHTAYVTFHSNDPVEPLKRVYLTVTIEATKLPRLTVEPAVIDLGVVLAGEPATCTVKVANIGDGPLHVTDLTASPGVERAGELPKEIAPGARQELKLKLSPGDAGMVSAHVVLTTDDLDKPVVTIPIQGYAARREQVEGLLHGVLVTSVTPETARVTNHADGPVQVSVAGSPERTALEAGQSVVVRAPGPGRWPCRWSCPPLRRA